MHIESEGESLCTLGSGITVLFVKRQAFLLPCKGSDCQEVPRGLIPFTRSAASDDSARKLAPDEGRLPRLVQPKSIVRVTIFAIIIPKQAEKGR